MSEETTTTEAPVTVKPGWKSTEFWLTLTAAIAGLGVLFGFVSPAESGEIVGGITQIVGGVMSILPVGAYAMSRGKSKQSPGIDINQVIAILAALSKQQDSK